MRPWLPVGLATAVQRLGDAAQATWRGLRSGPVRAYRYVRDQPARVLAFTWMGGLATFVGVGGMRVYEVQVAEAAAADAELAANAAKRPQREAVVAMLDIEEIEQLRDDRMRVNGIAAAGDKHGPTRDEIATAKQRRAATAARVTAPAGEEAGRAGGVVVVTKDGIAGWLERNKDKKPDAATLEWLRKQEKKDGRGAYAAWAGKDTTDLTTWFELDRQRKESGAAPVDNTKVIAHDRRESTGADAPRGESKAGAVAAAGADAEAKVGAVATAGVDGRRGADAPHGTSAMGADAGRGDVTPRAEGAVAGVDGRHTSNVGADAPRTSTAGLDAGLAGSTCAKPRARETGCAVPAVRRVDLVALGKGAVAAIAPVDVEVVESLQRRIAALGWPSAITVTMYGGRVIVRVPATLVFAKSGKEPELSDVATQIVRELSKVIAGYDMRSMRIVAAAGPEILELAGAFVVAGCDPARLEAVTDAASSTVDLVLVPYRRRGPS